MSELFDEAPKDLHWLVTIFEETLDAKDAEVFRLRAIIDEARAAVKEHESWLEHDDLPTYDFTDILAILDRESQHE